jgi:calcineurin-like phosphoesterase family protein
MKCLLLTDLHLGAKNNSQTWWRSQSDFIDNQVIPYAKEHLDSENDVVICLGDVFDSRSSISVYIAHETRKLFERLAGCVKKLYIICGNHDTYTEQTSEYCSLDLAFAGAANNIVVVSQSLHEIVLDGRGIVMIPWHIQKLSTPQELSEAHAGKFIFTHADIITGAPKLSTPVFSGHVHTPYISGNIRNLGSCYPIDFHDSNQDRYFYIWEPATDDLKRIANKKSIKFWRVRNEELLEKDWSKVGTYDYVEVYIKYSLLQDDEYQELCKNLRKDFKNCWIIPLPDELNESEGVDISCDMASIIENAIPDDLRERFEYIKAKVDNNGGAEQ